MTLLVKRIGEGNRIALYVVDGGRLVETVTACHPQFIADYLASHWPTGTIVRWMVAAPKRKRLTVPEIARRIRAHTFTFADLVRA